MRRKRAAADSLDLLLDTICNTFGGVLFIAILVIMLLNTTSNQAAVAEPQVQAQEDLAAAQDELAVSQAELDKLRAVAQEQDKLKSRFSNPEVRDLLTRSAEQQADLTSTSASRASNLNDAAQAQAEANRLAQSLAALDAALTEAKANLAAVDRELQRERQVRTRAATLPRQRQTSKTQVSFLITGGRIYAYTRLGPTSRVEHEARDTREVSEGGQTYLVEIPGGGQPVDPRGDAGDGLTQKFSAWDPRRHCVVLAVWPDSFEHFAVVRQFLVARGFEYRLELMDPGQRVTLGVRVSDKVQ